MLCPKFSSVFQRLAISLPVVGTVYECDTQTSSFTVFYGSSAAGWRVSQLDHHHFVILVTEQLLILHISEV